MSRYILLAALVLLAAVGVGYAQYDPAQPPKPATSYPLRAQTPTTTPVPLSPTEIMESSVAAMRLVDSFHFEMDVMVRPEGVELGIPVTLSGDFQAPDRLQGTLSITIAFFSVETEIVAVGDTLYTTDFETREWQVSDGGAGFFTDPAGFVRVEASLLKDLVLVGVETVDGAALYHLRATVPAGTYGVSAGEFQASFWVSVDDGLLTQVVAEGDIALGEEVGDLFKGLAAGRASVSLTLKLSDFGELVSIEAPDLDAPVSPAMTPTPTPTPLAPETIVEGGAGAGQALSEAAQSDAASAAESVIAAAERDPQAAGAAIAAAASLRPEAVGESLAIAAATRADAVGAALAAAAQENAEATGVVLAAAAESDAKATGEALAAAASTNAAATGAALATAADTNFEATGEALGTAAESNADATGGALVASSKKNARATSMALGVSARSSPGAVGLALAAGPVKDPESLALLGATIPVEPWVPEHTPAVGPDPTGEGVIQEVGSPSPIERILARFGAAIPDAHVVVEDLTELSPGVPQPPSDQIVSSYLTLTPQNFRNEDLFTAHTALFVEKSWLDANQVHQWSVQFSRFDEELGAWTPSIAKRVREDEERVFYSVVVPGFSLWAITGKNDAPIVQFRVDDLAITPAQAQEGEPVTIQVQLTDLTGEPAEHTVSLWINSLVNSSQSVPTSPGETVPVTFTARPNAGDYDARVDRLTGRFTVLPAPPSPPEAVAPPPPAEQDDVTGAIPIIIGVAIAILVAGIAAAVYRRRRRQAS